VGCVACWCMLAPCCCTPAASWHTCWHTFRWHLPNKKPFLHDPPCKWHGHLGSSVSGLLACCCHGDAVCCGVLLLLTGACRCSHIWQLVPGAAQHPAPGIWHDGNNTRPWVCDWARLTQLRLRLSGRVLKVAYCCCMHVLAAWDEQNRQVWWTGSTQLLVDGLVRVHCCGM
jgi:hypothetical protein